jgi:hypothetical protein
MPLLLTAAAVGGVAASLGYRGSLEVVNRIAPPQQRSEVVSSYLMAAFGGNSLIFVDRDGLGGRLHRVRNSYCSACRCRTCSGKKICSKELSIWSAGEVNLISWQIGRQ